ncbi:MAG: PP2C family serine/threonine-protein phosphatase [Pseudomonadota bacterium]
MSDTATFQRSMNAGPYVRSAFFTHSGAVRPRNEDAYFDGWSIGVWAVADGMGGHEGGNLASTLIVDRLKAIDAASERIADVAGAVTAANNEIRALAQRRFEGRTIGSTVAALVIEGAKGVCLWAGDSRIYRLRNGALSRLTRDHSQAQEMIDAGALVEGSEEHVGISNVITRAVGADDVLELEQRRIDVAVGDIFLLCTDGLVSVAEDLEIEAALNARWEEPAQRFVELALDRRVRDNVTVGVVEIVNLEEA